MSNDVATTTPIYDDESLANVKSFEDAIALLESAGQSVTDITEYGDGFAVLGDKKELVNVPFVILDYKFSDGDYGDRFAIVRVVTQAGGKYLLTDGGTGIRKQVEDLERRGVRGGVLCKKGLSVSEYDYIDDKGKRTPASTFYLAM